MSCASSEPQSASPKKPRANSERRPLVPVTPQRLNSVQKQNLLENTPLTPSNSSIVSSPFTPITNVYSSTSTFATPNSSVSSHTKSDTSPAISKLKAKSLADAACNWRTRAKENGIKVSAEESGDVQNRGKSHRRSRQALFQAKSSDSTSFISPQAARRSVDDCGNTSPYSTAELSASLLNTPEPSRSSLGTNCSLTTPSPQTSNAIVQKLRQRGSLTDPARTRRRETFGGLSLKASPLFDINEDEVDARASYAPYLQSFGSPLTLTASHKTGLRSVSAPFYKGQFYELDSDDEDIYEEVLPAGHLAKQPALRPIRSADVLPANYATLDEDNHGFLAEGDSLPAVPSCSVCSATSCTLSILTPCKHVICSSCLTGALNIIGEKDMRCATCEKKVDDFKLLTPVVIKAEAGENKEEIAEETKPEKTEVQEEKPAALLPSAIEGSPGYGKKLFEVVQPLPSGYVVHESNSPQHNNSSSHLAVLRIDNVPWDITPPALREFFHPFTLVHAHVLLDPKGKTLSHAFVEVDRANARDALRAVQNKTMGKGKRLRGVTVTMSNQAELMRAIFPSWSGGFEGAHPTLANLDNISVVRALETGIVTSSELEGLSILMRNPKSHFLKVPCLPFYSLLSILAKFPIDGDSRVFWNNRLRDELFQTVNSALTVLSSRIGTELHDQYLLDALGSAAVRCPVFSHVQANHFRSITGKPQVLDANPANSPMMPPTPSLLVDDVLSPDDSASVVSRISKSQGNCMASAKPPRYTPIHSGFPMNSYGPLVSPTMPHPVLRSPLGFGMPSPQLGTHFLPFAANSPVQYAQNPYDKLAHEFGMEPDVVAAIAQRIVASGVPPNIMFSGHSM